jgi:hypothetical protein
LIGDPAVPSIELSDKLLGGRQPITVGQEFGNLVPVRRPIDQHGDAAEAIVPWSAGEVGRLTAFLGLSAWGRLSHMNATDGMGCPLRRMSDYASVQTYERRWFHYRAWSDRCRRGAGRKIREPFACLRSLY